MKIRNLILAICTAALLTACGGGNPSDPRAMVLEFADAFVTGNFDKCNTLMVEEDQDEFTPEKDMSELEKAVLVHIREQAKKMKYKFVIDEEESTVEERYAFFYLTVTSESDPEFEESVDIDLDKDPETGRWGVERYGDSLSDIVGF
jgi:hypothetical protein